MTDSINNPAVPPRDVPGPRAAYTKRLFELAEDAARLKKKDDAYGRMKLLLLAAVVVVAVVAVVYHTISMAWIAVPVVLFVYFAVMHEKVFAKCGGWRGRERFTSAASRGSKIAGWERGSQANAFWIRAIRTRAIWIFSAAARFSN